MFFNLSIAHKFPHHLKDNRQKTNRGVSLTNIEFYTLLNNIVESMVVFIMPNSLFTANAIYKLRAY